MVTNLGFSGSLSQGSLNSALLRAATPLMPAARQLKIGSIAGIPLYDGDVDAADPLSEVVTRLKDEITASEGLLLVTPENDVFGVPGADWPVPSPDQ